MFENYFSNARNPVKEGHSLYVCMVRLRMPSVEEESAKTAYPDTSEVPPRLKTCPGCRVRILNEK